MWILIALFLFAGVARPAAPPTVTAVGHQYRQDDLPAIAAAPDGSLWVAWLSFSGERDDLGLRRFQNGRWGNLLWVPGVSGDAWLPQVAADSAHGVRVVWSQQVNGNWDLYARRFDPERQEWGALERLTSDPLPDINPRLWSDGKGRAALVWQGFRGKNSNIFLKILEGERWSPEIRITDHAANDWEPAVAVDCAGTAWVAYDSYKNGNYDVFLARVAAGRLPDAEIPVATSLAFEARATVAVDNADRVWVAWESGPAHWGKDNGYIVRDRMTGTPLDGAGRMRAQVRWYENGRWREPAAPLAFPGRSAHHPHVFADAFGSVSVAAKLSIQPGRKALPTLDGYMPAYKGGFYQYAVTRFLGNRWSDTVILPESRGRLSTRISAAATADGVLHLAWPAEERTEARPTLPRRQRVYTASLAAAGSPAAFEGKDARPGTAPAETREAADVRAIRGYVAEIGGKKLRLLRGDFHRHTELSWDAGGDYDGSLQDFYRYMIDAASMDFGASTDHQGGLWPYWWWYTQKMTDMYHTPGAYVPIFGYERTAWWPFGHRNIFFARRSEARLTPLFLKEGTPGYGLPITEAGDEPTGSGSLVANDTRLLYEAIRGLNGIAIPHTTGNRFGTDWKDNDPALEPVVEIFQGCRTSFEQVGGPYVADPLKDAAQIKLSEYHPQGMVSAAWSKGYKLGVIASSDHFSTHISYAMVYTEDPTRQGILDAIRKRHTYGATDNIVLDVRMGRHFMGDEFALSDSLPLRVRARGTAAVTRVEVIKDSKVVYAAEPRRRDVALEYRDRDIDAARHYYYIRLMQEDGMIAWSSPFFVNYR